LKSILIIIQQRITKFLDTKLKRPKRKRSKRRKGNRRTWKNPPIDSTGTAVFH
jgi:hypothetical protein